jgi:hypothetical protein
LLAVLSRPTHQGIAAQGNTCGQECLTTAHLVFSTKAFEQPVNFFVVT